MSGTNDINFQQASDSLKSFDGKQKLDTRTRIYLGKCIKVVNDSASDKSEIQEKINAVQKVIKSYDRKVEKKLKKLSEIKDEKSFYIYQKDGLIKLKTLAPDANKIEKLKFRATRYFKNDLSVVSELFIAAKETLPKKKQSRLFKKSVPQLKNLYSSRKGYFKTDKGIKEVKSIAKALNIAKRQSADKIIASNLHERGRERYDLLMDKFQDRMELLAGYAVASTVGVSMFDNSKFMNAGGTSFMATEMEIELLEKFSENESLAVGQYISDLMDSKRLNLMILALESENLDIESERVVAKEAWQQILNLEVNQSVELDVGYPSHAMRLQFRKESDSISLTLYDTSGLLEFSRGNRLKAIRNIFSSKKEPIAITYKVPLEQFQNEGQEYMQALIGLNTMRTSEEYKDPISSYFHFLRTFNSMSMEPVSLKTPQKVQTTGNCFVQRVRASELDLLGPDLYKKFRKESLSQVLMKSKEEFIKQREEIYFSEWKVTKQEARQKAQEDLLNLNLDDNPKTLSKKDFKRTKNILAKLTEPPKTDAEWMAFFKLLQHNIAKHGSL